MEIYSLPLFLTVIMIVPAWKPWIPIELLPDIHYRGFHSAGEIGAGLEWIHKPKATLEEQFKGYDMLVTAFKKVFVVMKEKLDYGNFTKTDHNYLAFLNVTQDVNEFNYNETVIEKKVKNVIELLNRINRFRINYELRGILPYIPFFKWNGK
uniref:Peptidase M13 N-terminal domain-containing protein n=1 Tax=Clastoptera arizonana TaxID=38151 RepID=A0A1B6CJU2_9HEMI